MDSPDDFLSKVTTYPDPLDLASQISYDADFEKYLYATLYPPSSSAPTPTTTYPDDNPAAETRNVAKKRVRKKAPKLEYCTKEQINVRTSLFALRKGYSPAVN